MDTAITEVQQVLQRFQDGYTAREVASLDEFMQLFVPGDDAELIGIGAAARNQNEWFRVRRASAKIVESDWKKIWGSSGLEVNGQNQRQGRRSVALPTGEFSTDVLKTDEVTGSL
jgi:hypothetical protein